MASASGKPVHRGMGLKEVSMNSLASILVHVDALPRSRTRLELARTLARRLDATVTALYAVMPSVLQFTAPFPESGSLIPETLRLDQQRRDEARALVDEVQAAGDPRPRWAELSPLQGVLPGFVREALCQDLAVLGQYDPADPIGAGVPADFVESVVVDSGKPVLVLPRMGRFGDVGLRVLIAWKPAREAAQALSAALPLLQPGAQVRVVGWGCDPTEVRPLLLRHGIDATYSHEGPDTGHVGASMLSRAADFGADLLVMGCYGHARARELVLGGATHAVLGAMTLPVLMAH
ncbi:universal stress protein [Azohydromonas australica]|uniref:universal stress protein n=1 Tax=Azohydromonas australica TaxID=364039 RepID=UPI0004138D6C|nr:universal stress protein [Azohydromonas australica]